LEEWLARPASKEKIEAVTALYDAIGVRAMAEEAILSHSRQALALMDSFPNNEAREQLQHLLRKLATRKN